LDDPEWLAEQRAKAARHLSYADGRALGQILTDCQDSLT
jgi:hypothetical protein